MLAALGNLGAQALLLGAFHSSHFCLPGRNPQAQGRHEEAESLHREALEGRQHLSSYLI